jgi:hypothetical protein
MEGKLIPVPEYSSERCEAVVKSGQCIYKKVLGTKYCPMHAGSAQEIVKKEKLRNYRLQKFQDRIFEKADSDIIKSLREVVGILRIIMEETFNQCQDSTDLMIYSPKIADLASKIEKVVVSAHKLEESLGSTLDKVQLLGIANKIVTIIGKHVSDETAINAIVDDIGRMLTE